MLELESPLQTWSPGHQPPKPSNGSAGQVPARDALAPQRLGENGHSSAIANEVVPNSVGHASVAAPAKESGSVDVLAAKAAVRDLLLALGEDPDRDGLADTPRRVAEAMTELMSGRFEDPAIHLGRVFEQQCDDVVMLKNIELFSMCEHHLMPFMGQAQIAYLPGNGKVIGLSKLARLVEVFARRPQLQERLTNQIADALLEHAGARGVAVTVQAEHMCMKMRGVAKYEPVMHTVALRGCFKHDPDRRREILSMIAV